MAFHQPVLIAVNIHMTPTAETKSRFGVSLRIEFDELHFIARHVRRKRLIVRPVMYVSIALTSPRHSIPHPPLRDNLRCVEKSTLLKQGA